MVDTRSDISCTIVVVKKNGSLGGKYELDKRRWCILGNHDDCDIRIDSKKVAPLQALVSIVDGKVILEGLDPDIPAVVPNVASLYKGDKHRVKDEESFFIGNRLFRFSLASLGKKAVAPETKTRAAINAKVKQAPRCPSENNSSPPAVPSTQKPKRRTSLLVTDSDEILVDTEMSGNLFPVSRLETPSKDISAQFANDPPKINDVPLTSRNTEERSIGGMKVNLAYAFEDENIEPNDHAQVKVASGDDIRTEEAEYTAVPFAKGGFKGSNSQTSSVTAQEATAKAMGVSDVSPVSFGSVAQAEPSVRETGTTARKEPMSSKGVKSPSARQKLIYARLSQGLPATPLRRETASQSFAFSEDSRLTPVGKHGPQPNPTPVLVHSSASKKTPKPLSLAASGKPCDPKVSHSGAPESPRDLPPESSPAANGSDANDQTCKSSLWRPNGDLSSAIEKSTPSSRRKSVLFARSIELEAGPHYSPVCERTDGASHVDVRQEGALIARNFQSCPQSSPPSKTGREGRLQERIPGPPPNEQLGLLGAFSYPPKDGSDINASILDKSERPSTPQSESTEESDTEKVSTGEIVEIGSSKRTSGSFGEGLANFWRRISGGQAEFTTKDEAQSNSADSCCELEERSNSNTLSTSTGCASSAFEAATDEIAECTPDTSDCSKSDEDSDDEDASWHSEASDAVEEVESQLSGSVALDPERLDELGHNDDDYVTWGSDKCVTQGYCDDAYDDDDLNKQNMRRRSSEQRRDRHTSGTPSEVADVLSKTYCSSRARSSVDDAEDSYYTESDGPETPVVKFPLDSSESTASLTTPKQSDVDSGMGEDMVELRGPYVRQSDSRLVDPELQAVNSYAMSSSSEDYSIDQRSSEGEDNSPDSQANTAEVDAELRRKSQEPVGVNSGSSARRVSLMNTVFSVAKAVTKRFSSGHASPRAHGSSRDEEEQSDFDPEDLETASESSEEFFRDSGVLEDATENFRNRSDEPAAIVADGDTVARNHLLELREQVLSNKSANSPSHAKLPRTLALSTSTYIEREKSVKTNVALSAADYQNKGADFRKDGCGDGDKSSRSKKVGNGDTKVSYCQQSDLVSPVSKAKQMLLEDKRTSLVNISKEDVTSLHEVVKGVNRATEASSTAAVVDKRLWVGDIPVEELDTKRVAVLRKLLRERDLRTVGNKAALVMRLTEHAHSIVVAKETACTESVNEIAAERIDQGVVDTAQNAAVKDVGEAPFHEKCNEAQIGFKYFPKPVKTEQSVDEVRAEDSGDRTEGLEREEPVSTQPSFAEMNGQPSPDRSLYRKKTVKDLQWLLRSCLTRTPGRLRKEELIDLLIANGIGPDGNHLQAGVVSGMELCSDEQTEMFKTPRTSTRRTRNLATPLQNSELDFDEVSASTPAAKGSDVPVRASRSRPLAEIDSRNEKRDGLDLPTFPTVQTTQPKVSAKEAGDHFAKPVADEGVDKLKTKASHGSMRATAMSHKADGTPATVDCVADDSTAMGVEKEALNEHSVFNITTNVKHTNTTQPNAGEEDGKGEETAPRTVRRSTRKATKSSKARKARKAAKSAGKENSAIKNEMEIEGSCRSTHPQELADHNARTAVESMASSSKDGCLLAKGNKDVKLERLTVVVLRQMLKEAGLCQNGVKNVLIARLNGVDGRRARDVDGIEDSCDGCRNGEACVLGGGKR